ncbi:MAG: uracil-DNA glycosylase [Cyclobacteriaceae bacterium]|nr:uracil-DNA glycosylase [Cyclobacteriaceae bacterium]
MDVKIAKSWKNRLQNEFEKEYFNDLVNFVKSEYSNFKVFPKGTQMFSAFDHCDFDDLKAVIIGQDPYHGDNQANGLCFSVNDGVTIPPSLVNIFKEINSDLGKDIPSTGNLERWANQGVLLLNATLTVRAHSPGSHQNKGWEAFTDAVIQTISDEKEGIVFLLWGSYAQRKGEKINPSKHKILSSAHPSPFAANRGFFGNKHFSQTNAYLEEQGIIPINW